MPKIQAKYKLVHTAGNRKLGNSVSKTYTSKDSCPLTCPLKNSGCFGENFHQNMAWNNVDKTGVGLEQLLDEIQSLSLRSKLRINVVGDYVNPVEDIPKFSQFVKRKQLEVLNYTHHLPTMELIQVVKNASYVVNLSTESLAIAQHNMDSGVNTVVALPSTETRKFFKYKDINIVVCPEQYRDVSCENCMLCAQDRVSRRIVVGFVAHGSRKKLVDKAIFQGT